MGFARGAAVVMWSYAAGFGLPAVPVAVYRLRRGHLPMFLDLFPMYGGPWSARVGGGTFAWLLGAFLAVTAVVAVAAGLLWTGSRTGAVLCLALLPVEAVFWLGFALPIPWILGVVRVVLIAVAWRSLR
jgi:hypothetical protein